MEPYSAGAADARFEAATAPNGNVAGQEGPPPPPAPMDTAAPEADAAPEAAVLAAAAKVAVDEPAIEP